MKVFQSKKILIAVTGCIGVYKICSLVSSLRKAEAEVQVVMTKSAENLVKPQTFQALSGRVVLQTGKRAISETGMDHIEFSRWADVYLIAPCTANTLAKLAMGMADDLLTTLSLACSIPQIIAPAMNPEMLKKPPVQRSIKILKEDGFTIIPPAEGLMACGDTGIGRLPEEGVLLNYLKEALVSKT